MGGNEHLILWGASVMHSTVDKNASKCMSKMLRRLISTQRLHGFTDTTQISRLCFYKEMQRNPRVKNIIEYSPIKHEQQSECRCTACNCTQTTIVACVRVSPILETISPSTCVQQTIHEICLFQFSRDASLTSNPKVATELFGNDHAVGRFVD